MDTSTNNASSADPPLTETTTTVTFPTSNEVMVIVFHYLSRVLGDSDSIDQSLFTFPQGTRGELIKELQDFIAGSAKPDYTERIKAVVDSALLDTEAKASINVFNWHSATVLAHSMKYFYYMEGTERLLKPLDEKRDAKAGLLSPAETLKFAEKEK
ncbi:hypothetical protein HD806DRAFT_536799 [Xylariaceae sp. AK1471]|nr:hypothetical protein HD806DRAFT_536799 [Xylariaceae sp. AK1471]